MTAKDVCLNYLNQYKVGEIASSAVAYFTRNAFRAASAAGVGRSRPLKNKN